jgi:hypothetical protein
LAQALTQPGAQPQRPVRPLHAISLTIGVAFLSAPLRPDAPRNGVCALADIDPSTSMVTVKIVVTFLMSVVLFCEKQNARNTKPSNDEIVHLPTAPGRLSRHRCKQ